ncbi:unnamed protein product [Lasius platythorax]|uniref:Transposase domain-containing protein n=1 Tax=Lasius platythorax TaxID=488582 RepID=A0AAV2MX29_9HYME
MNLVVPQECMECVFHDDDEDNDIDNNDDKGEDDNGDNDEDHYGAMNVDDDKIYFKTNIDDVLSTSDSETNLSYIKYNINDERENTNQSEENLGDHKYPFLEEQLSASTTVSKGEVLLMSLVIGLRHSLSWTAITDILKMINVMFGERIVPDTKFLLHKYFSAEIKSANYHVYCPNCIKYLGIQESIRNLNNCECGFNIKTATTISFFVEFNLKDQLKKLLSNKFVIKYLDYRFKRKKKNDEAFEDIFDGKHYKGNKCLEDKLNLSYIFNTDGCQLADTSKVAIWPYYIMINELPPHIRTKYIIPAGLWVDKSQPNMNVFVDIFVKQANELSTVGISWNYKGKDVISKIFPLLSSVDSVARCKMLNMKQFNGSFGCTYCLHPTEQINNFVKFPISANIPPLRSDNDIKELMKKSITLETATAEDTFGIKRPSFLMNLKYFDLAQSLPPNYMHSVLLARERSEVSLTDFNEP